MPEFTYLPKVEVLQAFAGGSNPREPNTIRTCVRRWYVLSELCNDFSDRSSFTDIEWREKLFKENLTSWDIKPSLIDGCISTKTIKEIVENGNIPWSKWKQDYLRIYGRSSNASLASRLEYNLNKIEVYQPFNINLKTIQNDLKYFAEEGYIILKGRIKVEDRSNAEASKYVFADDEEFSRLLRIGTVESLNSNTISDPDRNVEPGLSENFQDFADVFWQSPHANQRFYIHADYEFTTDIAEDIGRYREQLAKVWSGDKGFPCKLTYRSASKDRVYSAIVYPVCIYYYQRAFYLCAFGCKEDESESSWYNYRLDRFQNLEILDWHSSPIPEDLQDKCDVEDDFELIDEIAYKLGEAYGFDIVQPKKTMLLRFEKDFHDRYIQNTWRHNSFKQIDIDRVEEIFKLTQAESELIQSRLDLHRDDAYYKMNYRVGDNSVIMRLRAWCPNVEVLFPIDLRDRMHDDIQKTWNLYRSNRLNS